MDDQNADIKGMREEVEKLAGYKGLALRDVSKEMELVKSKLKRTIGGAEDRIKQCLGASDVGAVDTALKELGAHEDDLGALLKRLEMHRKHLQDKMLDQIKSAMTKTKPKQIEAVLELSQPYIIEAEVADMVDQLREHLNALSKTAADSLKDVTNLENPQKLESTLR